MKNQLKFMSFWAINDNLDVERMQEQLDQMKACGLTGTVFHPRYYPGVPTYMGSEYLTMLSEVILYAKKLDMEVWIYDENGWPSGTANGKVLEQFPDSKCRWIQYENGKLEWHEVNAFNTFDREEMNYFVEVTYDGYRNGLSREAFEYVKGFFSDEVGFLYGHGVSMSMGGVPWCDEAEDRYRQLYKEDVKDKLELLFVDGEGCHQVRYRYWQILTDILAEAFYQNINRWCERYGKRYTAHLKGEENLFFQTSCSGSACWNLKNVNMPAVDALERYPGNHYYPRIASSLARQFSDGESLCEALGGSGWGLTPEDVEHYLDWLAESGINNFVFHLWQYNRSSASVRDWPPNIPMGMTWKMLVPDVIDRLKKRWDNNRRECRVLLVAPVRGVMASFHPQEAMYINEHNGNRTPLTASGKISISFHEFVEQCYEMGIEYDVSEERIVEEFGVIKDEKLKIGNAVYDTVIAGQGCVWEAEKLIVELEKRGILYHQNDFFWKVEKAGENQIPLEPGENRIIMQAEAPIYGMKIRAMDPVSNICVMEEVLEVSSQDESGWYYVIPESAVEKAFQSGELIITMVPAQEQKPFAFLKGEFLVKCRNLYVEKNGQQVVTDGDFYLTICGEPMMCHDLVTEGYPFCDNPVTVTCMTFVGESGQLRLGTVHGDGARVWVDGTDYGFVWGPAWEISGVPEGVHKITAEIFPNTFNTYGPHHHIDGDRHLTSPMQYEGIKNFADDETAPEYTLVPQWHFRKFGIGRMIRG